VMARAFVREIRIPDTGFRMENKGSLPKWVYPAAARHTALLRVVTMQ
jgi:hypothetical protein